MPAGERWHGLPVTSEHTDTSRYGSDPGGLWAAAEDDGNPSKTLADQRAWKRAAEADFPADSDVMCDPHTFMPLDQWTDVTLGVLCFAPDLAEKALARAAGRMSMVAVDGREFLTWEELEEYEIEDEENAYTPNYIADPERRPTGLTGRTDAAHRRLPRPYDASRSVKPTYAGDPW